MLIQYDKNKIREELTEDNIIEILEEFRGHPSRRNSTIISDTICHNRPEEGSHKLYYYTNSKLFKCYTGCENSTFDIFELVIKVVKIQKNLDWDLNEAVRWVANRFGLYGVVQSKESEESVDEEVFASYDRLKDIDAETNEVTLKEYDEDILEKFNYDLRLKPWADENIDEDVMMEAGIGYFLENDQISIPHYDKNNRLIGVRGRTMCKEDAERFGKYTPLHIQKLWYSHPLGFNLYGLNWSKHNIKRIKKAIVFESEKSVLKYISYFGWENNIAVACCGSTFSNYHLQLLLQSGASEIVIAFDRQFKKIGDEEFEKHKKNLMSIRDKYKNYATISFIIDKKLITGYKDSPIDCGKEKFLKLFKERIII